MNRSRLQFLALLASGVAAGLLPVGSVPAGAQEIVQQLPDPATETLNDALRRLSRNPESVPALVAAGRASLDLDDVEAARGFFTRAQNVAPEDGRVLVGLALVAVRRGEPVTALQLFENADAAGEPMAPYAAERGLAYDLVGRNDRAQRLYRLALSQRETPEVLRRLALSYAIGGNADAAEATLLPLLQRQDRAAYRTRAFALAIQGREEEAIAITETMLPQRLAMRLAPYLRYMPNLTRAQQAAAANLGRFPAANEVGRDTPAIAALAQSTEQTAPAPQRRSAVERLRPSGEPLGPAAGSGELPPLNQPATSVAQVPAPQPVAEPEMQSTTQPEEVAAAPAGEGELPPVAAAEPSFSLLDLPNSQVSSAPAEAEIVQPAPEPEPEVVDLAEAFADFSLDNAQIPSAAGAVDITTIEPPRESPAPAEPPPPAHPARHWVQVATGQDTSAFRFDWRRIVRNADGLLDGAEPFVARWGQTNRLLTGPYASAREAQEKVSALAAAGVDTFRFSSQEGEEVQSLD
ncbi:tetratricopeptide repeat protein [Aurantiacibacter sp. MUD11]|uniref:tetratricopeptide repeat protein n=1 Tax=Aurantiacibacter sp. MUD11 TaxID=3003265 RepID=UPI0022AAB20B|nr:tetratricopeptide repeat protein [Aurantiacibacter sp. MUD11]WAT19038.1 tetratricopeptide repeat protein [Aurantiacibacter sp. MUD11]